MKEESFYKSSVPLKPGRKFITYTLDFFICFICSILLFGLGDLIGISTPYINNIKSQLETKQNELYSLVIESKLDERSLQTNYLEGSQTLAKQYIYCSTLASLKNNSASDISENTYTNYYQISPDTDNAYYFYVTYKPLNLSDFSDTDKDKSKSGFSYYRSLLVESVKTDYFEQSGYPYLKVEYAKQVDSYLRDSNYTIGKTVYDALYSGYQSVILQGQEEFKLYYSPYIKVSEEFTDLSNLIYKSKILELSLSYVLSILICYLFVPLGFKHGRTVSYRIMQIGVIRTDVFELKWYNLLIKSLINIVEYSCLIPLVALTAYSSQAISIIDYSIQIGFNLLLILFISLVFMFLSFVFCFINRKTKQSISEFLSLELIKDGREFKVTESAFNSKGTSLKDGK